MYARSRATRWKKEAHLLCHKALQGLAPLQCSIALQLHWARAFVQRMQLVLQHLFVCLRGLQKRGRSGLRTHGATSVSARVLSRSRLPYLYTILTLMPYTRVDKLNTSVTLLRCAGGLHTSQRSFQY